MNRNDRPISRSCETTTNVPSFLVVTRTLRQLAPHFSVNKTIIATKGQKNLAKISEKRTVSRKEDGITERVYFIKIKLCI